MGTRGIDRGAFRHDGPLARYWWAWTLVAAGLYSGMGFMFVAGYEWPLHDTLFLAETALVVVLGAGAKAAVVFFAGVAICWSLTAALRRVPAARTIV